MTLPLPQRRQGADQLPSPAYSHGGVRIVADLRDVLGKVDGQDLVDAAQIGESLASADEAGGVVDVPDRHAKTGSLDGKRKGKDADERLSARPADGKDGKKPQGDGQIRDPREQVEERDVDCRRESGV